MINMVMQVLIQTSAQGGGFGGFGGASGFGGFEDIFESFLEAVVVLANPNAPRQGADLQYNLDLTFEEAIFGA